MHATRQGGHSALRNFRNALSHTNGSTRAFSRSCVRSRGALPVYLEPSSPELASLLATLNTKVLLPANLTKEQQKLVYRQENKAKLEAEPVEITLGDVTLPLEPLDRNRLPNRQAQLKQILNLSNTTEDWENVVRILEGLENAGIMASRREQIVRRLNLSGNQHLVLKCLQRPKATGVRLSDHGMLMQVLRGVHDKAAMADWAEDETLKAYRLAKNVVELMDDEEHCGGQSRDEAAREKDWRGEPVVVALPTEMAARLADGHGGNIDEVRKLANRLVAALGQSQFMNDLNDVAQCSKQTAADFTSYFGQLTALSVLCNHLLQLIIVFNALKTSRKVLGANMPLASEALIFEQRVEEIITAGVEALGPLSRRKNKAHEGSLIQHVKTSLDKCRRGLDGID